MSGRSVYLRSPSFSISSCSMVASRTRMKTSFSDDCRASAHCSENGLAILPDDLSCPTGGCPLVEIERTTKPTNPVERCYLFRPPHQQRPPRMIAGTNGLTFRAYPGNVGRAT